MSATHFFRSIPEPSSDARKLLVFSLSNSVYQLKLEGMLAAALRMEGWRPVVLTTSPLNTVAKRYSRAFGITDFVFLEDLRLSADEERNCALEAKRLLSGDLSFAALKEWSWHGSWIGPQILSSVSRARHEGAPDPADPEVRREIEHLLPFVLQRITQAEKLIDAVKPALGLAIEASYATYGPFVDIALSRGVNVIQAIQPWRDDTLTFKRLTPATRRMHPGSVSPESFRMLSTLPWTDDKDSQLSKIFSDRYGGRWFLQSRNQPGARDVGRDQIVEELGLDPTKKTAIVFSHILWDANLFYGSDLFADYGDWFVETVKAACANGKVNWLIKLHPANVWKREREGVSGEYSEMRLIAKHVGSLPHHVKILDPAIGISTLSLFHLADFGVTVRGTVGTELPCFGVPTITAGTGRYSGLGFTNDSSTREEYLAKLAELPNGAPMSPESVILAKRHALASFVDRQWPMLSFESVFTSRKGSPLEHNLAIRARSIAEVLANEDLHSFAKWAAESAAADYLQPAPSIKR